MQVLWQVSVSLVEVGVCNWYYGVDVLSCVSYFWTVWMSNNALRYLQSFPRMTKILILVLTFWSPFQLHVFQVRSVGQVTVKLIEMFKQSKQVMKEGSDHSQWQQEQRVHHLTQQTARHRTKQHSYRETHNSIHWVCLVQRVATMDGGMMAR